MNELKHITHIGTLFSKNIHRQMPILSIVVVIYLNSIVVLTPNGQFWIVPLLHSVSDIAFTWSLKRTGTPWNAVQKSSLPVSLGLVG
jgi:hypothetical protein